MGPPQACWPWDPTAGKGGVSRPPPTWIRDWVVGFSAVPGHTEVMSDDTVRELSRDHRYALMTMAVQSGHLSENLAGRRIGASTMPGENKLQS